MWQSDSERAKQLDSRYDCGYAGFPTRARRTCPG